LKAGRELEGSESLKGASDEAYTSRRQRGCTARAIGTRSATASSADEIVIGPLEARSGPYRMSSWSKLR